MSDFERDLQMALELSTLEMSTNQIILDKSYFRQIERLTVDRQDKHIPNIISNGALIQINTINQFSLKYVDISQEHGGPSASCGFFVCVHAIILEQYISSKSFSSDVITSSNLGEIYTLLTNEEFVQVIFRQVLQEIQDSRRAFVFSSPDNSRTVLNQALRQWVANFEIGDYLFHHSTDNDTCFIRYNEFPFRHKATPDHSIRIEEESRFGGSIIDEAKGTIVYGDNDSVYFIHSFDKATTGKYDNKQFYTPEEYVGKLKSNTTSSSSASHHKPRVCVIDLNGHFVVSIFGRSNLRLLNSGDFVEEEDVKYTLFVFNTTASNYIVSPAVAWTFDTFAL